MQAKYEAYNCSQELEDARVLQASQATCTERFYTLMRLIKVSAMITNAKIISSPILPPVKTV